MLPLIRLAAGTLMGSGGAAKRVANKLIVSSRLNKVARNPAIKSIAKASGAERVPLLNKAADYVSKVGLPAGGKGGDDEKQSSHNNRDKARNDAHANMARQDQAEADAETGGSGDSYLRVIAGDTTAIREMLGSQQQGEEEDSLMGKILKGILSLGTLIPSAVVRLGLSIGNWISKLLTKIPGLPQLIAAIRGIFTGGASRAASTALNTAAGWGRRAMEVITGGGGTTARVATGTALTAASGAAIANDSTSPSRLPVTSSSPSASPISVPQSPSTAQPAPPRPAATPSTVQPAPPRPAATPPVRSASGRKGSFQGFGDDVDGYIKEASEKYGMDEGVLRGFVKMEGGWTGKASPTGALGTGQFTRSTWNSLAQTPEGRELGMGNVTAEMLEAAKAGRPMANDPRADKRMNTLATALLAKQNSRQFLGKDVSQASGEELYMLHNIGPKYTQEAMRGQLSAKGRQALDVNGGRGMTGEQFMKFQQGRFNEQYAIANAGRITGKPAPIRSVASSPTEMVRDSAKQKHQSAQAPIIVQSPPVAQGGGRQSSPPPARTAAGGTPVIARNPDSPVRSFVQALIRTT